MANKKQLTNVHKHAIQGMVLAGLKAGDISKELDIPSVLVEEYIEETRKALEQIRKNITNKENKKKGKEPKFDGKDAYISKGKGGTEGIAIATRTSSERGDKKEYREYKPRNSDAIHIIDPDKHQARKDRYKKKIENSNRQEHEDVDKPSIEHGKTTDREE
jgi:hypothetical protein